MKLAILIPALNEARALADTLATIEPVLAANDEVTVFLVDDGSLAPITAVDLPEPTSRVHYVLARHVVNLGQGAALETARRLALATGTFDAYVTMDADGQHRAEDALELARAVVCGADVAFGNRFAGESNVPFIRRLVLLAARAFERVITGLSLHDAHNGLRAFSRRALDHIAIRQNRMAHATEIKQLVSRAPGPLKVVEVPVSVRYTEASMAKGQSSLGAFAILRDLFQRYLFEDRSAP